MFNWLKLKKVKIVIAIFVIAIASALLMHFYKLMGLKLNVDNWIPIVKVVDVNDEGKAVGNITAYLKRDSVKKVNNSTFAIIGQDYEIPKLNEDKSFRFVSDVVEARCSESKYRTLERYWYANNLNDGIEEPIMSNNDFQKTFASSWVKAGFSYDGGWIDIRFANEQLNRMSNSNAGKVNQVMFQSLKKSVAIYEAICQSN